MKQGWEYKKLGEIGHIVTGSTPSTKDETNYSPREYCFVKPSDLPSQGIALIEETEYYVSSKGLSKSRVLPTGSVLVSCIGSIGKIGILTKEACSNQQINAIIPKNDIDSKFIAYSIYAYRFLLESIANAPVVPIINKTDFSKIQIPLPPKSTQLSIVSELDKINELIRLKKEQLKDYDNLTQSIFYEMFGDPVENEKGWEVKKMKDVCTHIVDCPHSTPKKADTTTNYPCIRTSELKGGTISWSTMQYLEKDEYEKRIARLKPETGDIIFGREGTIGDAVILPSGYNFSLGQRTMLIRTDNEMIINTFMHRTLMSEWIKHQIEYVNVSSTVAHVNIKDFKLFDVPLPPLPLQHLFAQRIEQIERQKSAVQKSITDLDTLLASRMQYWFE